MNLPPRSRSCTPTDILALGEGIAADQLWFRRTDSDLEISVIGTTDKMTVTYWYINNGYRIEQFKCSDGKVLLGSQVDALVSAMAGFNPPAAGQTSLPAQYGAQLQPVLAANWH